jgi:hypothetical protein
MALYPRGGTIQRPVEVPARGLDRRDDGAQPDIDEVDVGDRERDVAVYHDAAL